MIAPEISPLVFDITKKSQRNYSEDDGDSSDQQRFAEFKFTDAYGNDVGEILGTHCQ